jgi:hypothetical protein
LPKVFDDTGRDTLASLPGLSSLGSGHGAAAGLEMAAKNVPPPPATTPVGSYSDGMDNRGMASYDLPSSPVSYGNSAPAVTAAPAPLPEKLQKMADSAKLRREEMNRMAEHIDEEENYKDEFSDLPAFIAKRLRSQAR